MKLFVSALVITLTLSLIACESGTPPTGRAPFPEIISDPHSHVEWKVLCAVRYGVESGILLLIQDRAGTCYRVLAAQDENCVLDGSHRGDNGLCYDPIALLPTTCNKAEHTTICQ